MEYDEIKKLIDDVSASKLTSFEITLPNGTIISMKKDNIKEKQDKTNTTEILSASKIEQTQDTKYDVSEETSQELKKEEDNYKYITSPMVGTFYIKPSSRSDSYVEVGKKVKKGDVLCVIEAMKLLNEIESDCDGEIVEIMVEDGQPVEFGQAIFKIK